MSVCDIQRCLLSGGREVGRGKYELPRRRLMATESVGGGVREDNQIYLTLSATSRTTN